VPSEIGRAAVNEGKNNKICKSYQQKKPRKNPGQSFGWLLF